MLRRISASALTLALVIPSMGCGDGSSDTAAAGSGGGTSSSSTASSGGAGGAGGGAADYTTVDGYCTAMADRADACLTDFNVDGCKTDWTCLEPYFVPDGLHAIWECDATRPCAGVADDSCYKQVGDTTTPATGYDAYVSACMTGLGTCSTAFSNDWCTNGDIPFKSFTSETYQALTPCFSKPCAEISACLEGVIACK